jgi:hypothetical protein
MLSVHKLLCVHILHRTLFWHIVLEQTQETLNAAQAVFLKFNDCVSWCKYTFRAFIIHPYSLYKYTGPQSLCRRATFEKMWVVVDDSAIYGEQACAVKL